MKIGDRVEIRTNGVITQKLDDNQWEVEIKMKNGSLGVGVPESKMKVLAESPKPGEIWAHNSTSEKIFIRADNKAQCLELNEAGYHTVFTLIDEMTQYWHKVV